MDPLKAFDKSNPDDMTMRPHPVSCNCDGINFRKGGRYDVGLLRLLSKNSDSNIKRRIFDLKGTLNEVGALTIFWLGATL